MAISLLIALVGLTQNAGTITFDAEKVGEVPSILQSSKDAARWVVGADSEDGSGNHYLVFDAARGDWNVRECVLKTPVVKDFDFSARFQMAMTPSSSKGRARARQAGETATAEVDSGAGIVLRTDATHSFWVSVDLETSTLRLIAVSPEAPEKAKEVKEGDAPAPAKKIERVLGSGQYETGADGWFSVHLQLKGDKITCDVGGKHVLNAEGIAARSETSTLGFFASPKGTFRVDDITIKDPAPALSQILQIRGMTCVLCEAKVENALKAVKGVKDAKASFTEGSCTVTLDENAPPDIDALIKAVEAIHFQATREGA